MKPCHALLLSLVMNLHQEPVWKQESGIGTLEFHSKWVQAGYLALQVIAHYHRKTLAHPAAAMPEAAEERESP